LLERVGNNIRMSTPQPFSEINQPPSSEKVVEWVDDVVQYYAGGAAKYGARLYWLKTLGISASVAVTVLSGISVISTPYPWVITIVAGLSTFLTTMLSATKAQEYYVIASAQQGKVEGELLLFYGGGGPYAKESTEATRTRLL